MNADHQSKAKYDIIIVGSGTCGATIARELCKHNKRVLILERGGDAPLKESLWGYASIANEIPVTDKLKDMRAFTTGGSTALYFAVSELPPLETFRSLGIDLSAELDDARKELPVAELSDSLIGAQAFKVQESALDLGYRWSKKLMLIDQAKCQNGYNYDAKWKARTFVQDAIKNGAKIVNKAIVSKVIIENKNAVGVEYINGSNVCKAYAEKIILSAGSLATPIILKNSGIKNVVSNGFYIDPNIGFLGSVPGLNARFNYCGCMGAKLDDDITLLDANFHRFLFNVGMMVTLHPLRIASYHTHIAVVAKIKDSMGGELRENNRYFKKLTDDDHNKLNKGKEAIIKILKTAGAKNIVSTGIISGGAFGTLRIKEHVDEKLQTEYDGLYVCDGSILPDKDRITPTLTLVCLAKYLAKYLV